MAAQSAPPPQLFETNDSDRAAEYLTTVFGTSIRPGGRKKGYHFRISRVATAAFAITTGTQSHPYAFEAECLPTLMICCVRTATVSFRSKGAEHRFGPGDVYLSNRAQDEAPFWSGWDSGVAQAITLSFPVLDEVAATAESRYPRPIRFCDLNPVNPAAARHLTSTIDYLASALRDYPQAMAEPLVAGAAGRLLAAAVLYTFPTTALFDPTIEDRRDAHPRTLRRAIAFIDDHAHLDISVADIAAAAHVTIRALQYAFRRHLSDTPTSYLRRVRLHHAHQELLAADPTTGATVTEIAARWGFFHPGRFAAYYRDTYGCPPYRALLSHAP